MYPRSAAYGARLCSIVVNEELTIQPKSFSIEAVVVKMSFNSDFGKKKIDFTLDKNHPKLVTC